MRRWYKGNLHTHTTNSDGDSSPSTVAAWYADNGYDFLALSDHDHLTDPATVGLDRPSSFLLVRAEELSPGDVHVNGFGLAATVAPLAAASVAEVIQRNADAVRAAGGVASINHPNYRWAVSAADLLAVRDIRLLEIYNGEPSVNNLGGAGRPSAEALWDIVLVAGRRLYGLAVDDAHHFERWGPAYSNPGRGFVCVEAERLTEAAILEALERGAFYASTGVELSGLGLEPTGSIRLEIAARGDAVYTTTFVAGGRTLDIQTGGAARYRPRGEPYVRVRVDDSNGRSAWLQPIFAGG